MCFHTSNTKTAKENEERFDSTFNIPANYKPVNKRCETIFQKEYWRKIALEQRCLILVDGFYEPHNPGGSYKNIPHYCKLKNHELFAFAGLYSELDDGLFTATIITTIANPFFEGIHNIKKQGTFRMPLVLDEADEIEWLNSDLKEGDVEELFYTFTSKEFEAYPVTRSVSNGHVDTNTSSVLDRIEYPELNTLF